MQTRIGEITAFFLWTNETLPGDLPLDALEVEAAGQFLAGHQQGIAQLGHVDLGDDVEGRHGG